MRHQQVSVEADDQNGVFAGVALVDLLSRAGVPSGDDLENKDLTKIVLVTGADGHRVAFALAEVDRGFTDRVILVADSKDGKPLPADAAPYQLVVPGEKRPGRWVRRIIAIDVVDPGALCSAISLLTLCRRATSNVAASGTHDEVLALRLRLERVPNRGSWFSSTRRWLLGSDCRSTGCSGRIEDDPLSATRWSQRASPAGDDGPAFCLDTRSEAQPCAGRRSSPFLGRTLAPILKPASAGGRQEGPGVV
jgi:Oxidoreductase molybdopterin binding domain